MCLRLLRILLQIASNCQALKFQESCYEGNVALYWICSIHADAACCFCCRIIISVKSKRTAQKPLHQQYELLYRPERKTGL